MEIDWRYGEHHMWDRHQILVTEANEALGDESRVMLDPDPASKSGHSARVIGWSASRGQLLLTVILVREDGQTYGATAWESNLKDRRRYEES